MPQPEARVSGAPRAKGSPEWHARLAAALLSTTDSHAALASVCEAIATLVGCDRVQIWRGDVRQLAMHAQIAVGYDAIDLARLLALRVPIAGMPLAPDFLERKYLPISYARDLGDHGDTLFSAFGIQAAAFVLLERGDRVLGALQLSWTGTPEPRFPDRALVDVVRGYAALAVDIHARTGEAQQTAHTLSETAMLLASIHDPDELLETLARKITDAVGCDFGAVYLLDPKAERLRFAAGVGPTKALQVMRALEGRVDRFEKLLGRSDDDVLEFADVAALPSLVPYGLAPHVSSYVNVPLRRGTALVGSLTLGYCERTGRFARRQLALAKGLAHPALVALETARLVRSLEEASRVKSDFVAAVSHDLRTPIHILVGYAEMLLDGVVGELTHGQSDLVTRIRERALQFRDLVDGILSVARIEGQRQGPGTAPVDLHWLCAELARELDDRRPFDVTLEWSAPPIRVAIDGPKVRMILRNLVSNALKFTKRGRVAFAIESDGANLYLRVADTGPGIAPEDRGGIFEMFQQGDAGKRAGGSGLGLGLYLVRRLADVLGGSVRLVEAEPGRTVFEVAIPIMPTPAPAA